MKRILLLLGGVLLCLLGSANAQIDSVYLTADSGLGVVGNTIFMHPLGGGDVKIAINCYNERALAALVYPFVETCHYTDLDPTKNNGGAIPKCYLGGRVEQINWGVMALNLNLWPTNHLFLLGATAMMEPPLMPGDGYIAKMTFTMPFGSPDTCICIDKEISSFYMMTHVDTLAIGYTPHFTARCFPIKRKAPTPPVINCPAAVTGYTEASVSYYVTAIDPEGDEINPNANVFFRGTGCGTLSITGSNPWNVNFNTTGCTPGDYMVCVEIFDEFSVAETCCTMITLESFYAVVTIGTVDCVFPGDVAEVPVNIFSAVDIGGLKLYIEYDPTVMTFLYVERGDLIDDFDGYWDEYEHSKKYFFQYFESRVLPCGQQCETYKIKIIGIADMPDGWVTGPLLAGEGELLKLRFKVARDANLQDLLLPVKFEFDYDFDLKAPSFSSATGESLYVDVDWPGETGDPNHAIFNIVTFEDGGVKVCSDAYCWTGDLNLNEYPYEIADAVLYANYFIYGDEVFDINYQMQLLASDVNQDGFYPSIADFVFLIRIILEDISPKHELEPTTEKVNVNVVIRNDSVEVKNFCNDSIGAELYVFKHSGEIKNLTLHTDMDMKYYDANGELRILLYSFEGKSIPVGITDLFSFEAKEVELVEVRAADFYGQALKSIISTKVLPTRFALMNNYPNPFNLNTNIGLAIPEDCQVSLKLYNIAGQLVKAYEGAYETGNHTITWDGTNTGGEEVASGIYFYRLVAGQYHCTKKMVLMK